MTNQFFKIKFKMITIIFLLPEACKNLAFISIITERSLIYTVIYSIFNEYKNTIKSSTYCKFQNKFQIKSCY